MNLQEMVEMETTSVKTILNLTWKDDMPKTKEEVIEMFQEGMTIALSLTKQYNENLFKEVEQQYRTSKKLDDEYL